MVYIEFILFFFFKQKTAYEMRISDWSSDVCSSDLIEGYSAYDEMPEDVAQKAEVLSDEIDAITAKRSAYDPEVVARGGAFVSLTSEGEEIGRASCRERVCQYV